MSISSSAIRKAGPSAGNGVTTVFPFTFKVFQASDVVVTLTSATGVETVLTLTTHYSVSLNASQDNTPGGSVTLLTAPGAGAYVTLTSGVPLTQPVMLSNLGGFYPTVINDALDRLTIFAQQLWERLTRTLTLPASVASTVSTTLPTPSASKAIGWSGDGLSLTNLSATDLGIATLAASWTYDTFTGTGAQTVFTLQGLPGAIGNCDVAVNGQTQVPITDFTLANATLTFLVAPANGAKILVRYGSAAAQGTYAVRTEVKTASAGQTLVTLTQVSYTPGGNNINVYKNGLRLIAGVDFTETSSTSITMTSALALNDKVACVVGGEVSGSVGAQSVGFVPGGTGAVTTNVQSKLRQSVTFKDFGAVGDGVTNDATAVQSAITALSAGGTIDGQGLTYKLNALLTGIASNTRIQNAVFDFSGIGTANAIFCNASGSIAAGVALTANTLATSAVVTVGSTTGFAVDDLVFLVSSAIWDSGTGTYYGQYGRIKSVDSSTQLTLYDAVFLSFNTADAATIAKVTPVVNVTLENVRFIGSGANQQNAFYSAYGENCNLIGCRFNDVDYAAVVFFRCVASTVDECRTRKAVATGLAYGYVIAGGCYACSVTNSWGEDCRHTVTIGDNDGINLFTRVVNNHAMSAKDAGFDSHPASMFTLFMGNTVENSAARFGASNHDGMISEGAHTAFIGNTVINPKGSGIVYQPSYQAPIKGSVMMHGNKVLLSDTGYGSSGVGCYVLTNTTLSPSLDGISIQDNIISGALNNSAGSVGVYLHNRMPGTSFENIVISGNQSVSTAANNSPLYLRVASTATNSVIRDIVLANNVLKTGGTAGVITSAEEAGSVIENITGGGNIIDCTSYAFYMPTTVGTVRKIRLAENIYKTTTTRISISDVTKTTDVLMDDTRLYDPVTITNSTHSVFYQTDWYICNRGTGITVTLPSASTSKGRALYFKNTQAQTVDSASSNVVPINSVTPGTSVLPATAGAWCVLYSDGTNWVTMQKG